MNKDDDMADKRENDPVKQNPNSLCCKPTS